MSQKWQYITTFVQADAQRDDVRAFLQQALPGMRGRHIPRYTPEALIPELDAYGADGWELVHMEPVYPGDNADVLVFGSEQAVGRTWTNTYFCVFKRPAG